MTRFDRFRSRAHDGSESPCGHPARFDRLDRRVTLALAVTVAAAAAGCGESPAGRTYYERNIEPILTQKCAGNTSGCHSTNPDDPYKFAAGNFDVTSFENIQKRRDVLGAFGAYPYPLLLIKSVPAGALKFYYDGKFRDIDVQHSGGPILDVNSDAYFTLQSWLENGATENGLKPATPPQVGNGACSHTIAPGFNKAEFVTPATEASFAAFKSTVQPILSSHGCDAGNCHGAPQSDFYITCGETDDELAFNFSQAWSFVNSPVEDSQLLRVPLAASAGGRGHTGGDQFSSANDTDYKAVRTWAEQIGKLDFAKGNAGKQFFADHVQPLLIQRGCAFEACHSPAATNDFKLRSGTQGFFSAVALEKNYELLKNEFMAFELRDSRRGRAVAKALLADSPLVDSVAGIAHRGGPVLETGGVAADPEDPACATFTPGTSSAFCTFQAWVNLEHAALLAAGQVTAMEANDTVQVVYVERPAGTADVDRLAFDTFRGGAELRVGASTVGARHKLGRIDEAGSQVISGGCGLGAAPDIQAPEVANDGTRVVFAARATAADPLGVYLVNIDGTGCVQVTPAVADSGGLKVHNFDPVFSPDGKWIVFASTRGKPGTGATRSRKRFLPQSDLWRVSVNGAIVDQGSYEQITFLSNSEVGPQFMREGRITMTTEKASDGFYQLSGRRINWDRTDYHPLLAQRAESPYADLGDLTQTKPSIGYAAATDIREGSDGNFLVILSDVKADGSPVSPGGGALGIFNRSIGAFEQGRTDISFLQALRLIDGANATGRAGATASYRAPVSLPNGEIMVSYASNAAAGNFDIVSIDPRRGSPELLFTAGPPGGKIRVDAVLAYKHPARPLYQNRRQLVFGGGTGADPAHSVVHMPDAPLVFTLLTGNLRRGRPVEAFRKARYLAIYSEGLCPAGNCGPGPNGIFESRQLLGTAKLASDGSVRVQVPSQAGVVLELQDDKHNPVVKMSEEHQLGPGEQISMGITEPLFNSVCGGCHGSITGHEIDVEVSPDALTGASVSLSASATPQSIGP